MWIYNDDWAVFVDKWHPWQSEYIQILMTKLQIYVDCKTQVSDDP